MIQKSLPRFSISFIFVSFGICLLNLLPCAEAQAQIPVSSKTTDTGTATSSPAPTAAPTPAPDSRLTPPVWQNPETRFITQYPHLKDNLYQEPDSHFNLGVSAGVLGVVANRMFFSANFFQVHYSTHRWDNEIFSTSYGTTTTQPASIQSDHFIFRTVPKIKITQMLSFGPLFGYEYVSFPNVTAVLFQNSKQTQSEPFSTYGMIYGGALAQTFNLEGGSKLRLTEIAYQENYSVTAAGGGWTYKFNDSGLRSNSAPLAGGLLFTVEVGVLF